MGKSEVVGGRERGRGARFWRSGQQRVWTSMRYSAAHVGSGTPPRQLPIGGAGPHRGCTPPPAERSWWARLPRRARALRHPSVATRFTHTPPSPPPLPSLPSAAGGEVCDAPRRSIDGAARRRARAVGALAPHKGAAGRKGRRKNWSAAERTAAGRGRRPGVGSPATPCVWLHTSLPPPAPAPARVRAPLRPLSTVGRVAEPAHTARSRPVAPARSPHHRRACSLHPDDNPPNLPASLPSSLSSPTAAAA